MLKSECMFENETINLSGKQMNPLNHNHKILWDFEIRTHQLILARRPDRMIINKKKKKKKKKRKERARSNGDFSVRADHRVKKKNKTKPIGCYVIKKKYNQQTK